MPGTKKAGFAIRHPGSSPRNVCTKSRLDNNSCGDSSFHNDFGNFGALIQKARILAYSSIAQAGYILIGLVIAPYSEL